MNKLTRLHIAYADWKERRHLHKLYIEMKSVGRNVHICPGYTVTSPQNVEIGSNVWIGKNLYAAGEGGISIGSGCILSRNIEILTSNHNYNSDDLMMIPYDARMVYKPVKIGENVWIGSRVMILPGVTIGEGSVIGAGAVVVKDIPNCAVVEGNPAYVIKYRNVEKYNELKSNNKIYLDIEYDYDRSSLRKRMY